MLSAGRLARRRATACAAAAVATALLAAPLAAAPEAGATAAPEAPTLMIAPVDPLLSEGESLEVTVSIDNPSMAVQPATTVDVLLSADPISTRYTLSRWFEGQAIVASSAVASVELPAVAALGRASETVTVDAEALGLDGATWGAYGLAASAPSLSGATSVVVRDEPGESSPTRLALAAPIDAGVGSSGLLDADELERATEIGGDTLAALDAALGAGATIGVDPAIGASAEALGDEAPEAALAWLERADRDDTYALEYANADPIAQVRAGAHPIEPLGIPREGADPLPASAGSIGTREPVIDATAAILQTGDLAELSAIGTVVLSGANLDEELIGSTPSALVDLDGVEALAADAQLQELIRAASVDDEAMAGHARAQAMALLAVITRERPSDARTLAAMLPASSQGSSAAMLADLASARFVQTVGIDDALELEPRDATLIAPTDPERAVGAELVQDALAQEAEVAHVASIVEEPSTLLAGLRLGLLAALPDAGRAVTQADRDAIAGLGDAMSDVRGAVQILPGSTLNATGQSAPLPIAIENRLDVPVQVVLSVRPSNALVTVPQSRVDVTVAAGSQERVQVPIEIVGTGTVLMIAQLHTPDGVPLGHLQTLRVNSQPTIETALAWVLGVAIVLLIASGIVRSVRKRRRGQAHGDLDEPTPEETA
ncbi:hypothetical protein FQ330_01360 [Agrococcus sediminis]|uniref:Uncharacterized protein n=1 Tax=Agrococcus sediminis TaxID=2599924 RepID=A0A5M8QMY0_9MICO|nr:DUF6049 family protein [Agrococcus sediminis]KAA6436106.1 hypothetical protein FQ330_01360 [Agrococcus sediminis]